MKHTVTIDEKMTDKELEGWKELYQNGSINSYQMELATMIYQRGSVTVKGLTWMMLGDAK